MARIESLIHAASLARAASDALTIASCGVTPARRLILLQEAEAALYGAIDLMWQAGNESFADRIAALSAEIVNFASPANNDSDFDPEPPTSGAARWAACGSGARRMIRPCNVWIRSIKTQFATLGPSARATSAPERNNDRSGDTRMVRRPPREGHGIAGR